MKLTQWIIPLFVLWLAPLVNAQPQNAEIQSETWQIEQQCTAKETLPPEGWAFPGVILTSIPDDGVRALRATVGTTYYIAFAGNAFLQGGALSPDGRWFAFPYGYVQTVATWDLRYIVQEIRVHSTDVVPQLRRRIPWRGIFQTGAVYRPGASTDLPVLQWLDNETLAYPQGSFEDGLDYVQVHPFAESLELVPDVSGDYAFRAPDGERGFRLDSGLWALFDLTKDALMTRFPAFNDGLPLFRWSTDSARFAAMRIEDDLRILSLFDRDGTPLEDVLLFTSEQILQHFAWSPNNTQFLFSLYDPQENEHRLYLGNLETRQIMDTCVLLANDARSAVWSPDGTHIALMAAHSNFNRFQLYDLESGKRYAVAGYSGEIIGWGAYE